MVDGVQVRVLHATDGPAMLALGHSRREVTQWIAAAEPVPRDDQRRTYVAIDASGRVLGSTEAKPVRGLSGGWIVGSTRVSETARSRGIGRLVCTWCERELEHAGASTTFCYIRPENASSVALYRRLGYSDALGFRYRITPGAIRESTPVAIEVRAVRSAGELRAVAAKMHFSPIVGITSPSRPLGILPPHVRPIRTRVRHLLHRSRGYASSVVAVASGVPIGLSVDDGPDELQVLIAAGLDAATTRGAAAALLARVAHAKAMVFCRDQHEWMGHDRWGIHVRRTDLA